MLWCISIVFRIAGIAFTCLGMGNAFATADDPDFYQLREGSNSKPLAMRNKPARVWSLTSLNA